MLAGSLRQFRAAQHPCYLFHTLFARHVANTRPRSPSGFLLRDHIVAEGVLFDIGDDPDYTFEPGLPRALAALSPRQRLAVVLVHGYGYTLREVAELTGIRPTTVQNHLARGLARLRSLLGVEDEH